MKAESHGQYFQAVIRGAFQCRKLGYEPLQGQRYDEDYDYGDEGDDARDLKFILGMDMSDDEFDTWLEDHPGGRD
jgi:hypothetical protein